MRLRGIARSTPLLALWIAVLAVDLLAVIGAGDLRFRHDFEQVFDSDNARFRDYQRFRDSFTLAENDIVLLFEAPDIAAPDKFDRIRRIALEARLIDGVGDTLSIFSLRRPNPQTGSIEPLLPAGDLPRDVAAGLLRGARQSVPGLEFLISEDLGSTSVIVTLTEGTRPDAELRAIVEELHQTAVRAVGPAGIDVSITGLSVLQNGVLDNLYSDFLLLNALGALLGGLACAVALRSWRLPVLVVLPSGTAMLWVLGMFGALGLEINVLTIVVPVLIVVLTYADALHLTFEMRRLWHDPGRSGPIAIPALARVGPACALASITTAFAFAGLLLSGSAYIRSLGIAGAAGTIVALACVLIVHPMLFATVDRLFGLDRLFAGRAGLPPRIFDWSRLPDFGLRHPGAITTAAILGLALAGGLYSQIEIRFSVFENIDRDSRPMQMLARLNDRLAPFTTIDVPVPLRSHTGSAFEAPDLARISRAHEVVSSALPDSVVVSLASVRAAMAARDAAGMRGLLEKMTPTQRARFLSRDGAFGLVRVHLADASSANVRQSVGRLERALARHDVDGPALAGPPTGLLVAAAFVSTEMIEQINLCFLAAALATTLLITVWFRSLSYGLAALLPNILPIALVGAMLAASGQGLQFWSAIALTIAFGLAVDDTVHVLNRVRLNAGSGPIPDAAAIRRSIAEVVPVIVITTAVLGAGLIGTLFSEIPPVGYFGALSMVIFLFAILADLVVLPACLLVLRGSGRALQTLVFPRYSGR